MISQFRRLAAQRKKTAVGGSAARQRAKVKPHPAIVFACQPLEERRLLASVGGVVFHDVNPDRVQSIEEKLQEGFNVYVDLDGDNVRDAGEPFDTSDGFGEWRINDLTAGNYLIRVEQREGFTRNPNRPGIGYYRVSLADTSVVNDLDFGVVRYATATGQVFFDNNGNGLKDGADDGLEGATVFIDSNRNGVLDPGELSKETDAEGRYRIDFLYPGFNAVRLVVPTELIPTTQIQRAFVFPSGFRANDLNFGLTNVGNIIGHVFSDLDGDGIQAPNEPDKANHIVYLDLNDNGRFDRGIDVSTRTNAAGDYYFTRLRPGGYVVRTVIPAATEVTTPDAGNYAVTLLAGQTAPNRDFALAPWGRLQGYVFNDLNANGIDDPEDNIPGRRVFIDLNGNRALDAGEPNTFTNADGFYLFTDLPPGRYFIDLVVPPRNIETSPPNGRHIVDVRSGDIVRDLQFGLTLGGDIRGRVFFDRNANAAFDGDDRPLAGRRVYIDANNNSQFDAGEVSAVTGPGGVYVLSNLRAGTYLVRAVGIPGTTETTPPNGFYSVPLLPGSIINNQSFGFALPGSLRGTVFNDQNANGVRGPSDTGRPNVIVYIDEDNDAILDPGEPTTLTDANGEYRFDNIDSGTTTVRLELPPGLLISVPAAGAYTTTVLGGQARAGFVFGVYEPATISGTVFNDVNQNGVQDGGEVGLDFESVFLDLDNDGVQDFDEPVEFTDINGDYAFTDLRPGSYTVRLEVPTGGAVIAPAGGAYSNITVLSGQVVANRDFAVTVPGSITGVVFNDLNGNGAQDLGETGQAGQTVFIDANNNNVLDPAELSVTTGIGGTYTFADLPPGSYTVRLDPPVGATVTTPAGGEFNLVLPSGGTLAGNTFGVSLPGTISGVVYDDTDGDGIRDVGEPARAGVTVFLDVNDNGALDGGELSAVTDANGAYSITAPPNTYDVRVIAPGGLIVTQPLGGFYDEQVLSSGQTIATDNFGLATGVSGFVFDDVDVSGTFNAGDTPLAGTRIFADLDTDGVFDAGEPNELSSAAGTYNLFLAPGTYTIIAEPAAGTATTPPGGIFVGTVVPAGGGVTLANVGVDVP
jgi:hypothetical protein